MHNLGFAKSPLPLGEQRPGQQCPDGPDRRLSAFELPKALFEPVALPNRL